MSDVNDPKPFVHKLFTMVSDASTMDIFSWSADGTAVEVLDLERFVSDMLPVYFKHSNFSSFIRQLNTYGFSKTDSRTTSHAFTHPDFRRGDPDRLHLIQRKSSHHPAHRALAAAGAGMWSNDADLALSTELAPLRSVAPDADGGGVDGGGGGGGGDGGSSEAAAYGMVEGQLLTELEAVRSQSVAMAARIQQLATQVQEARLQQATTRESIGKMMSFLSRIFQDSRAGQLTLASSTSGAHYDAASTTSVEPPATPEEDDETLDETLTRKRVRRAAPDTAFDAGGGSGGGSAVSGSASSASTAAAAASASATAHAARAAAAAAAAGLPPLHPMAQHLISSDLDLSSTPEILRAQLGSLPLTRMPSKSSLTSSLNAHLAGLSGGANLDSLAPASDTTFASDLAASAFTYGIPSSFSSSMGSLPNIGSLPKIASGVSTSFAAGLPSSVMRDASLGAQVHLDCA